MLISVSQGEAWKELAALTPGCVFSHVLRDERILRRPSLTARVRASSKCPCPPSGRPPLMHNAELHIFDANSNNVGSSQSRSGRD